jgi:alkanesulfonate monooxygenase SsuD/methylene tetrahydromethanopterin reductase-like flavin-dependent oxidoreductase (luciferase family)
MLGGHGPRVFDRVLAFADQWLPNFFGNPERMAQRVTELRRRGRDEQGRDIAVTVQLAPTDTAQLEVLEAAGVHRCIWYMPARDRASVERALDRYVEVVRTYRG